MADVHTKLYSCWKDMAKRCCDPNNKDFKNYGGRGITVCERWKNSFANFTADMGPPLVGMSLERIDNDGNYCPENCRWATPAEQCRNTRATRFFTLDGETLCMADWERKLGMAKNTLFHRLKRGWPIPAALTFPLGARKPVCDRRGLRPTASNA